ncbi:MAG: hypothetical protein PHF37_06485 [Phycisphaerae bacterium]|nr:hypothetical protein [Phycisphaerae bacterium]
MESEKRKFFSLLDELVKHPGFDGFEITSNPDVIRSLLADAEKYHCVNLVKALLAEAGAAEIFDEKAGPVLGRAGLKRAIAEHFSW